MKTNENEGSKIARLKRYIKDHPGPAMLMAVIPGIGLGVIITAVHLIWRYRMLIISKIFVVTLVLMVATLPIVQLHATGLNGQATNTNVYAAVFVVPDSSMLWPDTSGASGTSGCMFSYCLTINTNGTPSILMKGPIVQYAGTNDPTDLAQELSQRYGLKLPKMGGSAYAMNGSLVMTNIPSITYNPSTGGIVISNGAATYSIVAQCSKDMVNWRSICTNTLPAGFKLTILDDNPPLGAGFYRTVLLPSNSVADYGISGAQPGVVIAECGVALVIIVIGVVTYVYLYHLCKEYLPPPSTNSSTNSMLIIPSKFLYAANYSLCSH